jgi:hypothetical protein
MSEFLFIYRGGAAASGPEHTQQIMQKWMTWMKDLGEKGHIKDIGHPLEKTGKLVAGKAKSVTDGPYAETKDIVGGYSLIEAKDLDQAAQVSLGCPIFETGGMVEVRPIMKMNM